MKKRLLYFILIMLVAFSVTACGDSAENEGPLSSETKASDVYWEGTAYLSAEHYSNIAGANNLFPDEPVVTANNENTGPVTLRVIDGNGLIVGSEKQLLPGETVTMDKIPAMSGTYTIQGLAAEKSGDYRFSIE